MAYAEIAIFVTQEEYSANGYAAQSSVASTMRDRLDATSISYNIVEPTDTPDMSTQDAGCGDAGLLKEWRTLVDNCYVSPCTADSHLLITNSTTIEGCGENPGNLAVASGGPHVAGQGTLGEFGPDDKTYRTYNVCAQEVFHNFDVDHIHGDNYYSSQWGGHYITPMLTTYKSDKCGDYNACNSLIPCDTAEGFRTQWTTCAENQAESYLS